MKKIIVSALLITGLCSFRPDESLPAIPKGSFTGIGVFGYPKMQRLESRNEQGPPGTLSLGVEYQLSRRLSTGLQYSYDYSATGMQPTQNFFSHTPYQHDRWAHWNMYMATIEFCYVNKGAVSIGGGIGLGIERSTYSEHVIDSVGISTYHTSHIREWILRIRLIDAKLRFTEKLGMYVGLGIGSDGILAIGAHYTFVRRKQ